MAYRLILGLALFLVGVPANADIVGKPRVIDGDTIEIAGERIRLHGIDAPEMKQTCRTSKDKEQMCGVLAKQALERLVRGQDVVCKGDKRDRYKRLIAVCYAGPHDLNAKMVKHGWALAYRQYSTDYVANEANAKAQKLGLWRGQFVAPWEWRRGKRLGSEVQKSCCKICRKSKACGNSCISRTYTCRKPPGCACDVN